MQKYVWTAIFIALIIGIVVWANGAKDDPSPQPASAFAPNEETDITSNEKIQPEADRPTAETNNGMTIETTKEGTGTAIANGQTAVVQYEGKLVDGSVFDSTAKRGGKAFEFLLGAGMVIKGWDQGVLGMKVGETRVLTIPPELGYGASGFPPVIPGGATLIFTVTLEGIK